MNKFLIKGITLLLGVSLVGCAQMSKQDTGVLAGGLAGGLLGSQFGHGSGQVLAIGLGTLAGAYIGGSIGHSMDEVDRMRMNEALNNNNLNQPAYWVNQRTHVNYTVIPVRNVNIEGNPYCREYRTIAIIAGKKQQMYGRACRRSDGTWQAVS